MNLASTLIYCWKNHALPQIKWDANTDCISIGNFRFFYWHNQGLNTDEIKVIIVHPDGEKLIIVHQNYGGHGPSPGWTSWKHGKWDQALNDAVRLMEEANIKKQEELDDIREADMRLETEKREATTKKFEDLF